jgi:hypothetical protein
MDTEIFDEDEMGADCVQFDKGVYNPKEFQDEEDENYFDDDNEYDDEEYDDDFDGKYDEY